MSSKSAISRSAQISIILFVLAGGLLIGFAASNQLSSPPSQTIYETLVTTDTQSRVVESPVPTTITESTTFIATATVTTIQTTTTTNSSAIQALEQELSSLRNVSSQLQLELSVMEQAGKLSLSVFAVNQTITVPGNMTFLFATQVNDHNGTLVLTFPIGCPSSGDSANFTQGQYNLFVLLNPNVPGGVGTISVPISSTSAQFAVYFQNIGPSSATCTFSLFYIYSDS